MAVPLDQSSKEDDLKTQFVTREGTYRLMNLSEYSRPNRVGYTSNQNSPQVRVSLVSLLAGDGTTSGSQEVQEGATNGHGPDDLQVNQISSTTPSTSMTLDHGVAGNGPVGVGQRGSFIPGGDRICFNFGKELFVYPYRGMKKVRERFEWIFLYYAKDEGGFAFAFVIMFINCMDNNGTQETSMMMVLVNKHKLFANNHFRTTTDSIVHLQPNYLSGGGHQQADRQEAVQGHESLLSRL